MTTEYARLRTRGHGAYARERMPASGGSPIVAGMEPSRGAPLARGRALAADVLLVVGVAAVQVLGSWASERVGIGRSPAWRPLDPLAWILLVAGPLALLVRRRWPAQVLAVTLACGLAYAARTYPEGPSSLAIYPALWTVALTVARRTAWVAAGGTAVAVAGAELFLYGDTMFDGEPLYAAVTVFAAMWWGEAVGARRAYVAELRDRAERAERTREEEARRRVDEERMRIARELRDGGGSGGGGGAAPLSPAPGLGELDILVAQAAGAGVEVRVSLEGEPRRLPPAVDLAAYRVVQESLTNVIRHARAGRADITVRHADGRVVVEVTDDGRARPGNGSGNGSGSGKGILGMRERARALGGSLEAGPRPEGGFRVLASLPLGGP